MKDIRQLCFGLLSAGDGCTTRHAASQGGIERGRGHRCATCSSGQVLKEVSRGLVLCLLLGVSTLE
eukprot:12555520-Alexandrium_andersonii.AAC.1